MIKKILGILFLLIGAFFTLVFLAQIPSLLKGITDAINSGATGTGYVLGYIIGQVIALLAFGVATFFLLKFGLKWVRAKKTTSTQN